MKTLVYGEGNDARIENFYSWLKKQNAKEIVIRTSYVKGGWHDNEFDANAAGYSISRGHYEKWENLHQFSECYYLTKKN